MHKTLFICFAIGLFGCSDDTKSIVSEPSDTVGVDDTSGNDDTAGQGDTGTDDNTGSGIEPSTNLSDLDQDGYDALCNYAAPKMFLSRQTNIYCYQDAEFRASQDSTLDCETLAQECIANPADIPQNVTCDELELFDLESSCEIDVALVETCAEGYGEAWDSFSSTVDCDNIVSSLETIRRRIPFECRVIDTDCPTLFGVN